MYEMLIKNYLKKLSLKDINDFAIKNGAPLLNGEDKIIYDFIMKNWMEVYKGNSILALSKLKNKVSDNTYNNIVNLYNKYKNKII